VGRQNNTASPNCPGFQDTN
jgi:hypothetical protein